jgi:hypothetical protein
MKTTGAAFEGFGRDNGDDDEPKILTAAIQVYNVLACGRRNYSMLCHAVTLSVIAIALTAQELVVRWVIYFVNCSSIGTDSVIESLRSKLDPKLKSPTYVFKSKLRLHAYVSGRYPLTIRFLNSRIRRHRHSSQV